MVWLDFERWQKDRAFDYLEMALSPMVVKFVVDWTVSRIREVTPTAQAIAFRGLSGSMVAPIVAHQLDLNPIGIRKPGESSHQGSTVSRVDIHGEEVKRYVIVDDFVATGDTIRKIVTNEATQGLRLLGVFCYTRPIRWTYDSTTGLDVKIPCFGCIPDHVHELLQ